MTQSNLSKVREEQEWWEPYPHLWKILDSTGFPSCEVDYYVLVEFIKSLRQEARTTALADVEKALLARSRKLLDIDTDSMIVTERGKEHPIVDAVPVTAVTAVLKEIRENTL